MRARLGLAECLDRMGKLDEAAAHYRDLLRLNPNDNQGVRHLLLVCLLKSNKDDEARELLKKYRGDYALALWCYALALLTFKQKGDTALARKHLRKAFEVNETVPDYILEYEELPHDSPHEYGLGSDEEAMICADLLKGVWTQTTGAVEWLEKYAYEML
jgi:tetratricopeptide (TPR) repeat protein